MFTITKIYISLTQTKKVPAYVKIIIDNCFVIYDIKIIHHRNGYLVCMPDKRIRYNCSVCHLKCDFDSNYCKHCGNSYTPDKEAQYTYSDICHPITQDCRKYIDKTILDEFFRISQEQQVLQESQPALTL